MDPEPSIYLADIPFFFLSIGLLEISVCIVILILLLVASAMVSGSEIAFFSLSPGDQEALKEEQTPNSKRILKLLAHPGKLLATILISNNFINIAIVILSSFVIDYFISGSFLMACAESIAGIIPFEFSLNGIARFIDVCLKIVAVTFLLVLFGEVAPKIYASINNLKFSKFMARPLSVLNAFFGPLSNILVKWSDSLEKRLEKQQLSNTTKEEIDQAIELTVNQDDTEENEADILRGIINFSDLLVKQIMCPRTDIIGFEKSGNFHDLLAMIKDSGYSRIPIYEESMDKLAGILYVKDLISYLSEPEGFPWQELIRDKLIFVPETKKVNELLKEFQEKRVHLAIVVDEYGGVAGLVTLEDVMEEVIGDIKDEFDEEEELDYVKINDRNYIFEGKTSLTDVARIIDLDPHVFDRVKGESESLAGMIIESLGEIPKVDKEIMVEHIKLKVVAVNKRRIEKVTLTITE